MRFPFYQASPEARTSDETARATPVPSPEYNNNPIVDFVEFDYPDHYRYSDANTRVARRGYIAFFKNPAQFWQADTFGSGHLITGKQNATTMRGGMRPDSPSRANIRNVQVTSYGDLVTLTSDLAGIEPVSGW